MLTLLLAFAPLIIAYLQIALIARFMGGRRRRRRAGDASADDGAELAGKRLTALLGTYGLQTEAGTQADGEGCAPIEIVCRDPRPLVGGLWVVHALLPADGGEPSEGGSADVLMLADRVWRARGVKGVLVANGFSTQARTAARNGAYAVELIAWGEVASKGGSDEMLLRAGPRAP